MWTGLSLFLQLDPGLSPDSQQGFNTYMGTTVTRNFSGS